MEIRSYAKFSEHLSQVDGNVVAAAILQLADVFYIELHSINKRLTLAAEALDLIAKELKDNEL